MATEFPAALLPPALPQVPRATVPSRGNGRARDTVALVGGGLAAISPWKRRLSKTVRNPYFLCVRRFTTTSTKAEGQVALQRQEQQPSHAPGGKCRCPAGPGQATAGCSALGGRVTAGLNSKRGLPASGRERTGCAEGAPGGEWSSHPGHSLVRMTTGESLPPPSGFGESATIGGRGSPRWPGGSAQLCLRARTLGS